MFIFRYMVVIVYGIKDKENIFKVFREKIDGF